MDSDEDYEEENHRPVRTTVKVMSMSHSIHAETSQKKRARGVAKNGDTPANKARTKASITSLATDTLPNEDSVSDRREISGDLYGGTR